MKDFIIDHKNPLLFEDPGIQYPIEDLTLSFADYITKTRKCITTHRVDLEQNADLIVEANCPFESRPSTKPKRGILLIHGLLNTPFLMKDIANNLQDQELLIRSILLPGHATVPGALLNTHYEEWVQAVRFGVESLKKEVDQVYLAGFSTGAALSLYYALLDPRQIAGLVLLSPAFKIKTTFDFALPWNQKLSLHWPKARWFVLGEELDYAKYHSMPVNAVYQVYRLTQALKENTNTINCPIFMALSTGDRIVDTRTAIQFFLNHPESANQMIVYSDTPRQYNDQRIIVRNSCYPEWNIANFCHISIPVCASNPHYGIEGDYHLASRVQQKQNRIYTALDKPTQLFWDIMYKCKLTPFQRQRLTFNPDFDFMMQKMKDFIRGTSS